MIFRKQVKNIQVACAVACILLLAGLAHASPPNAPQIASDQKAKIKGTIVSRSGDLVKVNDKKTASGVIVVITDNTKIERNKFTHQFFVHKDMDVTAMVPGLSIEA
jgi:hypothetical protein